MRGFFLLGVLLVVAPICVFAEGFEREGYAASAETRSAELSSLFDLARDGNPQACYHLGMLYLKGQEVERSVFEAMRWLHCGAEKGHVESQFSLARLYADGNAVEEALRWYREAARNGHRRAQNNLGRLYAMGLGVHKDYVEAYRWWLLSADQGDRAAERNREKLGGRMSPEQIEEAERLARLD